MDQPLDCAKVLWAGKELAAHVQAHLDAAAVATEVAGTARAAIGAGHPTARVASGSGAEDNSNTAGVASGSGVADSSEGGRVDSGNGSSSSNSKGAVVDAAFVAATACDDSADSSTDTSSEYDPWADERASSPEWIMREDGLIEPAPGHGKKRTRKRGKASRQKSRKKQTAKKRAKKAAEKKAARQGSWK